MAYKRVIRFVLSEGEMLAHSVLSEIPQRKALNYPTVGPGPLEFLSFLEDFVRHTLGELKTLREQLEHTPDELLAIVFGQAKQANSVLKYGIRLLDWVNGASTESLPFPLVPPCERFLRRFHPEACVIFKCTLDYNYELQTLPRESLHALVPVSLIEKYFWPVIVVRIPAAPIANTLTHSLISHELGHAVYKAVAPQIDRDQPRESEILRVAGPYLARLGVSSQEFSLPAQPTLDDLLKTEFGKTVVARSRKGINIVVENWIQEFFADSVGCLLLGPAFFCAYNSFLAAIMPLDRASSDHPRDRLRVRNILSVLRDSAGYSQKSLARQARSLVREWTQAIREIPRDDLMSDSVENAIFEVAERIVTGCLPLVRKAARDATEHVRYQTSSYLEDVEFFVELLQEANIPPIERERENRKTSLDLASVLNVGWETLLRQQVRSMEGDAGPDGISEDSYRQRVTLSDMIFRAIDLGEVRRQWEEANGNSLSTGAAQPPDA